MKTALSILTFIMVANVFSQTEEDIRKLLKNNKFQVTKSKIEIPKELLAKLDSIVEIAAYNEKWSSDIPSVKFNWAAKTSNGIWFICLFIGTGYHGPIYRTYLFINQEKIDIRRGYNMKSFRKFKKSFIHTSPERF